MQTWLSYHFYPLEEESLFLSRALRPFLEQYIWPTKGTRAFFVRYQDEKGPHIRIRLRADADFVQDTLREAFQGWFAERGAFLEVSYQAEPARFGGDKALAWAEEHFHLSTRVTLDRLKNPQTYGDALFDALRLQTIAAFAAGFDQAKAAWYFGRLCELWLPLFFQVADETQAREIRTEFENNYEAQAEGLRGTLAALWAALESQHFDTQQPEWLRWLRGNELIFKELGSDLEKALPSLLHLTNNRLGVSNQDEVFLAYILSRALSL